MFHLKIILCVSGHSFQDLARVIGDRTHESWPVGACFRFLAGAPAAGFTGRGPDRRVDSPELPTDRRACAGGAFQLGCGRCWWPASPRRSTSTYGHGLHARAPEWCGSDVGGDPKTVQASSSKKGGDPKTDHAFSLITGGDPRTVHASLVVASFTTDRGGDPKTIPSVRKLVLVVILTAWGGWQPKLPFLTLILLA